MVWTAPVISRTDEPFVGDERAMLDGFLDWHRATLLHKCGGLTGEQLARQAVPPSHLPFFSASCATSPPWSGTGSVAAS